MYCASIHDLYLWMKSKTSNDTKKSGKGKTFLVFIIAFLFLYNLFYSYHGKI